MQMGTFNGQEFGREVVSVVKDYIKRQVEPLEARIRALEDQAGTTKTKAVLRVKAPESR